MPLSKIVAKSITDDTITTDQIADNSVHGRRNVVINGAMRVHQRGNQTSTSGSSVYFVDRWNLYQNTGALGANLQQSTVVPSGQGFGNSLLIDCTTVDSSVAAGDIAVLRQVIEGQDLQSLAYGTSNAKSLTLSFWVRSTKTGTYGLEIYHNDKENLGISVILTQLAKQTLGNTRALLFRATHPQRLIMTIRPLFMSNGHC